MADNDYHIIKPVEILQNIGSLKPAKRRKDRQRRDHHEQNEEEHKNQPNGSTEESSGDEITENNGNHQSIDYCA